MRSTRRRPIALAIAMTITSALALALATSVLFAFGCDAVLGIADYHDRAVVSGDEAGADGRDGGGASGEGGPGEDGQSGGDSGAAGDSGPPACGVIDSACCAGNTCNGGAQCNGTICVCPSDKIACGTSCVDTKTDVKNCGRCNHDCLAGACNAGTCAAYTVTTDPYAQQLFTDGGRVYWIRYLTSLANGGFFSAKLDGTDPRTIFDAGNTNSCTRAAVALGKAYFLCANGLASDIRVCTLPCAAGSSTVLKPGIATAPASASALAADPSTGTVYYAVATPYNQPPNGSIFDIAGNRVGGVNQANPNDLAIANGSIYWLNSGTYSADTPQTNGGVKRASLVSPATESVVVTAGNAYFDNGTLAVDANNVYYSGRNYPGGAVDTDIVVANASGTNAAPAIFAHAVSGPVVSDGTNVFLTMGNTVRYCSRVGGCGAGPTVLANENGQNLAVDAESVMWVGNGIRRIAKP